MLFVRRVLSAFACGVVVSAFTLPACVVKLADRNSPLPNGGVTGPPANCAAAQVPPGGAPGGEPTYKFVGRFDVVGEAPPAGSPPGTIAPRVFDWSGSYITAAFGGTDRVTVKIQIPGPGPDAPNLIPQDQMFEFVVDNLPTSTRRLTVKDLPDGRATNIPLEEYEIVGLDRNTQHEITIYKNTEAQKGAVIFKGMDLHGGQFLPPTRRARRIEFIGDSIICGYGNKGENATCPFEVKIRDAADQNGNPILRNNFPIPVTVPVTENQYLSFTAIAARKLDADAVTTCWSGKGVYKNYKEKADDPDSVSTVPQLWKDRTIASDPDGAKTLKSEGGNKWDFAGEPAEEKPQVVVAVLGTNDFARDTLPLTTDPTKLNGDNVPDGDLDNPVEFQKFFDAYLAFAKDIRATRPEAHIFLAVPPMLTDQFPLENARRRMKETLNRVAATMGDPKLYVMELVEQGFRYGLGCDYHPNLQVHTIMADQLVGAIQSKTCWPKK
jgi:hypothetical protein